MRIFEPWRGNDMEGAEESAGPTIRPFWGNVALHRRIHADKQEILIVPGGLDLDVVGKKSAENSLALVAFPVAKIIDAVE